MAALPFVVHRHRAVVPFLFAVVVGCFAFQDGDASVRQLYKKVHICLHKAVEWVPEQLANSKDFITGFKGKDFGHQVFQTMTNFFSYPVVFRLDNIRVAAFIVVQIPQGGKWGNPHDGSDITTADPLPPIS